MLRDNYSKISLLKKKLIEAEEKLNIIIEKKEELEEEKKNLTKLFKKKCIN